MQIAAFSKDESRVLTWSDGGTARLWDPAKLSRALAVMRHEDGVRGTAFSGDKGRVLTWSKDATAQLWDTGNTDRPLAVMRHEGDVKGATISKDKKSRADMVVRRHRAAVETGSSRHGPRGRLVGCGLFRGR